MKINQRFIVKLALGFVAMGGLLILVALPCRAFPGMLMPRTGMRGTGHLTYQVPIMNLA
ncbi:hypothetical protein [Enterococcus asini]|uniref:hypothetical protein n=1 Tax=Enterococcus asini TaxID=57732 RepID=UPI0015F5DC40|nr:hypothetical protein [Enterococcus asini]